MGSKLELIEQRLEEIEHQYNLAAAQELNHLFRESRQPNLHTISYPLPITYGVFLGYGWQIQKKVCTT